MEVFKPQASAEAGAAEVDDEDGDEPDASGLDPKVPLLPPSPLPLSAIAPPFTCPPHSSTTHNSTFPCIPVTLVPVG